MVRVGHVESPTLRCAPLDTQRVGSGFEAHQRQAVPIVSVLPSWACPGIS